MTSVTVSPKFQVVIPKELRESTGIVLGQNIQMLIYQNRIELIPIYPTNLFAISYTKNTSSSVLRVE